MSICLSVCLLVPACKQKHTHTARLTHIVMWQSRGVKEWALRFAEFSPPVSVSAFSNCRYRRKASIRFPAQPDVWHSGPSKILGVE